MLSVIIPARNEADCIDACLAALAAQDRAPSLSDGVEVIVAANDCRDDTVARARAWAARFEALGYGLKIVETARPGKARALDLGDRAARADIRLYLDADVVLSPPVLGEIATALDSEAPRFASGTMTLAPATNRTTRLFARVWTQLPFFAETAPAAGLYAVNTAGRARWGRFPDLISDDSFVRAHFAPGERIQVAASYTWPLAEGASRLLRTRRRQEVGLRELVQRYPDLAPEPDVPHSAARLGRIALRDPAGAAVYVAVTAWAKLTADMSDKRWHRGR